MNQRNGDLKLGLIGCGAVSHAHCAAADRLAGVSLVACCDVMVERAAERAEEYGMKASYPGMAEMLKNEELNGVIIATWPTQHPEHIGACLDNGINHILCEKPLCTSGEAGLEILKMVEDADAFIMEAFMFRHNPAIGRLEEILAARPYGEIDCIKADYSLYDDENFEPDNPNRGWRRTKELAGGMPWDHACYCVNGCMHFAKSLPTRVFAHGSHSQKYETVNRLYGMIEYKNGITAIIESSKKAGSSRELQIVCETGRITLPHAWLWHDDTSIIEATGSRWDANEVTETVVPHVDSYQLQLKNFADSINGRAQPRVTLRESLINTITVEALVTSFLEKRPVDIELPEELAG